MKSTKSGQSSPIEQLPRRRICTSWIVPLLLLRMLPAGLGLMMAGRVTAQTFTTLYSFTGGDGAGPVGGLILSGNTLYGTAAGGGSAGVGTVFAVNTDGTGFRNLHSFTATSDFPYNDGTNSDGASPNGGLILSGNTLYGTAPNGGPNGYAGQFGLAPGYGTVFKVNTNGTGFTVLHSFAGYPSDGASPNGGLIVSGNTLYGTAESGGSWSRGTVFKVNSDGTGFTNLHSFTTTPWVYVDASTNSDGAYPEAGLILSSNTLYGTAFNGGTSGAGTVFAINTDGSGFTNLHSFTGSDGFGPKGGLIVAGNTLYGTTSNEGSSGRGTVFAVNTDGTGFTNLYGFTVGRDGGSPQAGLILSGNSLYGTTFYGGTNGCGTVFSIFIQPRLTMTPSGPYVILTWPTNYSGFTLQSTTNLGSSAAWTTNSSPPVVIGGENVVINTMSGRQKFFRLSQ